MDYDILYTIFDNYNYFYDLHNIIILNKYFYNCFITKYNNNLNSIKINVNKKYPVFISKLFNNNIIKLSKLNELEFNYNYIDIMGYIKNINIKNLKDDIMYCNDQFNNCFIVIKLKMNINNCRSITTPIIIFQKKKIYYRWCINSIEPYYGLIFNSVINYRDIVILSDLLQGKRLKRNNCEIWI